MIKIANLKIPLIYTIEMLKEVAAKRLGIDLSRIESLEITKRSVDNSDKQNVYFSMTVAVCVYDEDKITIHHKDKDISREAQINYTITKSKKLEKRPIVVGLGPAGLFTALILAQAGARPIVLERGQDADSRKQSVSRFWQSGILDTNSNVQFGEGGAGAFSDGKLKTGLKDARKLMILKELVEAGAPPEIMYLTKPHIGTDKLCETVKAIRKKIISLGGEVRFNAAVTDILRKDGKVIGVGFIENGAYAELCTDNVVLAIGHSARDTFKRLYESGIAIEQRPFAIGVRIEHPQQLIDKIQYGSFAGHPSLGAADYRMVVHLKNGRGVYTFCMCPGGTVVAATSEENCLVTNGMSEYARDGKNANTALLVTVNEKDVGSNHPLAGVMYQREIEQAAFKAGGGNYKAPVQRLEDFMHRRITQSFGEVVPTYKPSTQFAEIESFLPEYITDSLRQAVGEMEDWMPGFYYPDAVLTGAETRSSSPVRIPRRECCQAVNLEGLYPCGEGAGYAGGIISAAADGVICAERILGD